MTSIVQDIQAVRSIRKDLRDVTLPINILNSIESIHNCIKTGTDLNGWKKVDWRGSNSGGHAGYNSVHGGNRSGTSGNTFFGHRQSSNAPSNSREYHTRDSFSSSASTNYSFCNRSKGQYQGRQSGEQSASIPLVSTSAKSSGSNSSVTNVTHVTPVTTASNVTSTTSTPVSTVTSDGFRLPPQKYVSRFKKSSEKVEDTILNTILLGKLNKFSEQNYDEIKEFITHIIDSGQSDMIKCFMKLVFEKAASEEMFCPLYAKLLSELSARYPILLTEMANLYSQYMEIFEEVSENSASNYNEVCKRNIEKKYRRGYSQFLAELIKHDVIDTDVFMKTVNKILSQVEHTRQSSELVKLNEEFADCLMKIMKAIQTNNKPEISDNKCEDVLNINDKIGIIHKTLKTDTSDRIKLLTIRDPEMKGMSNKARFTFLDIYDGIQKL